MAQVVRTASAKADVIAIAEYIAEDNPSAAERWLKRMDETLRLISEYPAMGERVDHLGADVRRHCFGNYLLFYVPTGEGIELRRVLHGAVRIEKLS